MNIADSLHDRPIGRLSYTVFRSGQIIERFDEDNLVVNGYRRTQARLLGGDTTNNTVSKIGFGVNGAATVPATNMLSLPFIKAIDAVSYPSSNSVLFNFSLLTSENNGMNIFEVGLLTGAEALYARRVRPTALPKTADLSISGSWLITFP